MDSLDLLAAEDAVLRKAFELWDSDTLTDRVARGHTAKFVIRNLALRERARDDVLEAASAEASAELPGGERSGREEMRSSVAELSEMSRGVAANQLELGQPFREAMARARALFEDDLARTGDYARIRTGLSGRLHSARYIRRHTPSHMIRSRRRLVARNPLLQAVHAGYDWLRRTPTFERRYLPEPLRLAAKEMFSGPDTGDGSGGEKAA